MSGGRRCNEASPRDGNEDVDGGKVLARRTPYLASLGTRVEDVRSNPPAKNAIETSLSFRSRGTSISSDKAISNKGDTLN